MASIAKASDQFGSDRTPLSAGAGSPAPTGHIFGGGVMGIEMRPTQDL